MISSGRYGNSPAVQDPQSGYNPRSPQYNPLSPQYGMSSVYSRGTPVYNPSGNNNNLNNIQSPIQSDEEGEDENKNISLYSKKEKIHNKFIISLSKYDNNKIISCSNERDILTIWE